MSVSRGYSLHTSRREFLKQAGFASSAIAGVFFSALSCRLKSSQSDITSSQATRPYYYTPPVELPQLLDVPGCAFRVAADRRYSMEHIWVLPITKDMAVLGITEKMVTLFSGPYGIDLPAPGRSFKQGDTFGYAQGFKMNIDLICPISGTVVAVDNELLAQQIPFDEQPAEGIHIPSLANDTYRSGWMVLMRLNEPEELESLLTPEEYIALCAKGTE